MTTRYDIKSWRKTREGKAYTVRLGSAWTDKNGVLQLNFDALPAADSEGQTRAFLEEPRERPSQSRPESAPASGGRGYSDLEDDIPFAPEVR